MNLSTWLRFQGFTCFTLGEGHDTWEDHPVSQSGIRIEIAGDVASIWCSVLRVNHLCVSVQDVRVIVERCLIDLGRFKRA